MPLRYLSDEGYALGMMRDEPSWLLPKGAVYDSLNLVWDKPGIARQRQGTTNLVTGAQTAFSTSLGFVYSTDATPIEELYGLNGKTAALNLISKTTGATTSIGTFGPAGIVGRPVRHFGFLIFPIAANAQVTHGAVAVAGQTSSTSFTSVGTSSINANDPQLTVAGGDTTTNVKVGAVVVMTFLDAPLAQWVYWGRVVSIDSSTKFTVWPVPTVTGTAAAGGLVVAPARSNTSAGGACAASFQNRLLIGNTMNLGAATPVRNDRRVVYSILPTETSGGNIGATFVESGSWPRLNYFDVSGADTIVAMEPVSGNQLLILTSTHPVVLSGNLVTQTATTSPTITYDLSDVTVNAGCLSDLSVQRTPRGIVWAGAGGIYAWDGRQPIDLTTGTINTYWRGLVNGSSFSVHGSAYVRGYYLVSGSSGGSTFSLMADLTGKNPKWTRASGAGTDIFYGVARPTNANQVFAARWWDQAGAAPSMTNGQTVRLESMLNPHTVNTATADADGSTITLSLTTRVITGDAETQKIFQRGTIRYQLEDSTVGTSVTAQSKIDAADIDATSVRSLGSLSNTMTMTLSNATNANPIVCTTTANHGLQTDDFVDIDGVLGNLNANGRWRIFRINQTTFHLVGSVGSAAYTSGGKVKKLTESDYTLSALNAGQGASVTITGNPNNFEMHGVRLAVLEKPPVMSA